MAYSDVLISRRNSLLNLDNYIESVKVNLENACGKIESANNLIADTFSINNVRADNMEIEECLNNIRNIISECSSCRQLFNNDVSNLNNNIRQQLSLEEAERKKNEQD